MSASDWQDNKLIWSGTVVDRQKGQSIPLRQEIIRENSDRFSATYFVPDSSGGWKPVVDETCERTAPREARSPLISIKRNPFFPTKQATEIKTAHFNQIG